MANALRESKELLAPFINKGMGEAATTDQPEKVPLLQNEEVESPALIHHEDEETKGPSRPAAAGNG